MRIPVAAQRASMPEDLGAEGDFKAVMEEFSVRGVSAISRRRFEAPSRCRPKSSRPAAGFIFSRRPQGTDRRETKTSTLLEAANS
jgi:hypothetical protein